MYVQPQESPFDIYQPLASLSPAGANGPDVLGAAGGAGTFGTISNPSDAISRFAAESANAQNGGATAGQADGSQSSLLGILNNLIAQLGQMVAQLGGQLGFGQGGGSSGPGWFGGGSGGGPCGSQQFFQNASGGSTGDPHLSFNGQHWNDMQSQANLIDSNSFDGGFNVSTQTTAPNSRGVTYNQSAAVTTDYGSTQVTLDNKGNAVVTENGQQIALGESVGRQHQHHAVGRGAWRERVRTSQQRGPGRLAREWSGRADATRAVCAVALAADCTGAPAASAGRPG